MPWPLDAWLQLDTACADGSTRSHHLVVAGAAPVVAPVVAARPPLAQPVRVPS